MAVVRRVPTEGLRSQETAVLRALFDAAWADEPDGFTDQDWANAIGGLHFLLEEGEQILAHASVVERAFDAGGHRLATGYVEAVATWPAHQRRGHASAVMGEVADHIDQTFQLGALDAARPAFYERLGWMVWKGPTYVRTQQGLVRTAEEDGYVLVRLTPTTPELDLSTPISCDWRPGDVW